MEIQETETENGILFSIKGSLSGTQRSTLHLFEVVSNAIEKNTKGIVIDLKDVCNIDSMSVGLLVGVILKSKEKNILMHFQNIPQQLSRVFQATQLVKVFPELY